MNIVLIEIDGYAHFAQSHINEGLPGQNYFLTGNSFNEAAQALDGLPPKLDRSQKTLLVVAGTLNDTKDEPGSAFELVAAWLTDGPGREFPPELLGVIANSAFTERLSTNFAPFVYLQEACRLKGIPLYKHGKQEGIRTLIDMVNKFYEHDGAETKDWLNPDPERR